MNSEPGQRNAVSYGSGSNNLQLGGLPHLPITLKTPVIHAGIVTGNGTFPVGIQNLDRGITSIVSVPNEFQATYMSASTAVPIENMPTQFSSLQGSSDVTNSSSIDKVSIHYKNLLDSIIQSQGAATPLSNFGHCLTNFNHQQQQHSHQDQLMRTSLNQNPFLQTSSLELPTAYMQTDNFSNSGKDVKEETDGMQSPFSEYDEQNNPNLQEQCETILNDLGSVSQRLPSTPMLVNSLVNQSVSKASHCISSNGMNYIDVIASCNDVTITTTTITTTSCGLGFPMPAHVHSRMVIPAVTTVTSRNSYPSKTLNGDLQYAAAPHPINSRYAHTSAEKLFPTNSEECILPQESSLYGKKLFFSDNSNPEIRSIIIPFGWRRVVEEGVIVYYSPSNIPLSSFQEVQEYLSSDGTCKCGLQCPILLDKVFNFDICVMSRQWTVDDVNCAEDLTKLCNHKRKIVAMATLQNSQENIPSMGKKIVTDNYTSGTDLTSNCHNSSKTKSSKFNKKTKEKNHHSPYDEILVSQLIAERDKLKRASSFNSTVLNTKTENIGHNSQSTLLQSFSQNANIQQTLASNQASKSPFIVNLQQNNIEPQVQIDGLKDMNKKTFPDQINEIFQGSSKVDINIDHNHQNNVQNPILNLQTHSPFATLGLQPSPLTIQTVFPPDQLKHPLILQPSSLNPLSATHPAFSPYQNQVNTAAAAALNMQLSGNAVLATPTGFYPQINQTNSMLFHMQTVGNQKFASPLVNQNSLSGIYTNNISTNLFCPITEFASPDPILNCKVKRARNKKDKKKCHNIKGKTSLLMTKNSPSPKYVSASFLDNPAGYLAQQTEIVNGSITSSIKSDDFDESNFGFSLSPQKSIVTFGKENLVHQPDQSSSPSLSSFTVSESNSAIPCKIIAQNKTKTSICLPSTGHRKLLSSQLKMSSTLKSNVKSEQSSNRDSPDYVNNCPIPNTCLLPQVVAKTEFLNTTPTSILNSIPATSCKNLKFQSNSAQNLGNNITETESLDAVTINKNSKPNNWLKTPNVISKSNSCDTCQTAHLTVSGGNSSSGLTSNCLQQILNQTSDFPASNLLSAAARAQIIRTSPPMNVLFNQQIIGTPHINQPLQVNFNLSPSSTNLLPPTVSTTITSKMPSSITNCFGLTSGQNAPLIFQQAGSSCLNGIVCGSTVSQNVTSGTALTNLPQNPHTNIINQTSVTAASHVTFASTLQTLITPPDAKADGSFNSNHKDSSAQTAQVTSESVAVKNADSLINKNYPKNSNNLKANVDDLSEKGFTNTDACILPGIAQCINPQLTNMSVNFMNNQFPFVAMNTSMPPMSLPIVTSVTNSITQLIPTVGISQTSLNQSPVMHVVGTFGTQSAGNPLLIAGPLTVGSSNHQQLGILHSQIADNVTANSVNHLKGLSPQLSANLTTGCASANNKEHSSNECQPKVTSNCVTSPVSLSQSKLFQPKCCTESSLAHASSCFVHSRLTNGNKSPNAEKSNPPVVNNLSQFSTAQFVVLPNMQLPLLQILGTGVSADYNKVNFSATPFMNHTLEMPTLVSPSHGGTYESSDNFYSLPPHWASLNSTNLSIPLQTIHLQQQLLQMSQLNQTVQHTPTFYMEKSSSESVNNSEMSENAEGECPHLNSYLENPNEFGCVSKISSVDKEDNILESCVDVAHQQELQMEHKKPSIVPPKELNECAHISNVSNSALSQESLSGLEQNFAVDLHEKMSNSANTSSSHDCDYPFDKHLSEVHDFYWKNYSLNHNDKNSVQESLKKKSEINTIDQSRILLKRKANFCPVKQTNSDETSIESAITYCTVKHDCSQDSNGSCSKNKLMKSKSDVSVEHYISAEQVQMSCSYSEDSSSNHSSSENLCTSQSLDESLLKKFAIYGSASFLNNNEESEDWQQKSKLSDDKAVDGFQFNNVGKFSCSVEMNNLMTTKSHTESHTSCPLTTERAVICDTDYDQKKKFNRWFLFK